MFKVLQDQMTAKNLVIVESQKVADLEPNLSLLVVSHLSSHLSPCLDLDRYSYGNVFCQQTTKITSGNTKSFITSPCFAATFLSGTPLVDLINALICDFLLFCDYRIFK